MIAPVWICCAVLNSAGMFGSYGAQTGLKSKTSMKGPCFQLPELCLAACCSTFHKDGPWNVFSFPQLVQPLLVQSEENSQAEVMDLLSQTCGVGSHCRENTFCTSTKVLQTKLCHTPSLGQDEVGLQKETERKRKKRAERRKHCQEHCRQKHHLPAFRWVLLSAEPAQQQPNQKDTRSHQKSPPCKNHQFCCAEQLALRSWQGAGKEHRAAGP